MLAELVPRALCDATHFVRGKLLPLAQGVFQELVEARAMAWCD